MSDRKDGQSNREDGDRSRLEGMEGGNFNGNGSGKTLMRLMDWQDWTVMIISCVASIVAGALTPLTTVLVGRLASSTRSYFANAGGDASQLTPQITRYCLFYVYLAIAEFASVYVATVGFMTGGERITQKVREQYLAAILRQEISFFDNLGAGEVTNRISGDINLLQDGLTGKLALFLTGAATFGAAFIISFVEGWRLGLVLLSAIIAIVGSMTLGGTLVVHYTKESLKFHGQASSVAQDAVSAIRQVMSLGIQDVLIGTFDDLTLHASRYGLRSKCALALMIAIMNASIYWAYGLAFWQGSRFLTNGDESVGAIITTLLAVIAGAFALGNVSPHLQAFGTSIASANKVFETIGRASSLSHASEEGIKLPAVIGNVEFQHVSHTYPSRPDTRVLTSLSFQAPAGQRTALVGPSGSGKSTVIGLLERFYQPQEGVISLDGHNVSSLNLRWLRQQISLVSQEPVLFSTTIFENISLGLDEGVKNSISFAVLKKKVTKAAKDANALEFIEKLPKGFSTEVGDQGRLLSGGQKQRIAIARAIIKEPRLLLLDEATSALDVKAEGEVQKAIESASRGRTTIIIAHRLSTITNADRILVISKGVLAESGTHAELLRMNGIYAGMIEKQTIRSAIQRPEDVREEPKSGTNVSDPEKLSKDMETHLAECQDSAVEFIDRRPKRYSFSGLVKFVAKFNRNEGLFLSFGLVFSVLAGLLIPTNSVLFAKVIETLSLQNITSGELRSQIDFWSLMYLMLGSVAFICWLIQGICFAISAERLVVNAKHKVFSSILYQDLSVFDGSDMTSGAVARLLSTSINGLAGMSGITLGTIICVAANLAGGLCLSLAVGWKLALVCSTTIPLLLLCGWTRLKMLALLEKQSKSAYERSATYACEAASSMRTVASLTVERHIFSTYRDILQKQRRHSALSTVKSSLLYAATQSINFLCAALAFWWGGRLIVSDHYSMFAYFVCYSAIVAGAYSAGAIFSFAPDMGKAREAAEAIRRLVEMVPSIDARESIGKDLDGCEGRLTLEKVCFNYPNRLEQQVLQSVDLVIKPGQHIAFCGASGSGKSTIVSLLERFYDPTSGVIRIDDKDIKTLNVQQYRRHLALVTQEPVLFSGTIRSNIAAGKAWAEPSDVDIRQACKDANILDFIESLPHGLTTEVGTKGIMLSGGQRQRIAIARALIRSPRILILDEATSALDTESERAVQEAIEAAVKGRTTISVAHRLSTIQRADCIFVLGNGKVIEQGTHDQLMAVNGQYSDMVRLQSMDG